MMGNIKFDLQRTDLRRNGKSKGWRFTAVKTNIANFCDTIRSDTLCIDIYAESATYCHPQLKITIW